MDKSAIQRTPPEIWKNIFEFATEWLLLPGSGSDLVSFSEKWESCDHLHRYLASQKTLTNLRLVCRSWSSMAISIQGHLVITDFKKIYWPFTEYLQNAEYIEMDEEGGSCLCGGSITKISRKWNTKNFQPLMDHGDDSELSGGDTLPKARVLHLTPDKPKSLSPRLIQRFSYLRVFTWSPCKNENIVGILRHLEYLTHLRLEMNDSVSCSLGPKDEDGLSLPYLRDLRLEFMEPSSRNSSTSVGISAWHVPKLSILDIRGDIDPATLSDFERFLGKVGPNIQSLLIWIRTLDGGEEKNLPTSKEYTGQNQGVENIAVAAEDVGHWVDMDGDEDDDESDDGSGYKDWKGNAQLWKSFQNVSIIGISMTWFERMQGIPKGLGSMTSSSGPLTVCLVDLTFSSDPEYAEVVGANVVRWCERHPGNVQRISIPYTWRSLAAHLARITSKFLVQYVPGNRGKYVAGRYRCARAWINQLKESKIPVCDMDGVLLGGEETAWFMEGLRKMFPEAIMKFSGD